MIGGHRVLGVVPARAGSKRLPGKNRTPLGGRPLVEWTFAAASSATTLDAVHVSSDDPVVLTHARRAGLVARPRPAHLAGDRVRNVEVLRAIVGDAFDIVALLQPTSPLRTGADIDRCLARLVEAGPECPACVSVTPVTELDTLPLAVLRRLTDGRSWPVTDRRAATHRLNGAVYATWTAHLQAGGDLAPPGATAYVMPPSRSIDIDTAEQLAAAEARLGDR